MNQRNLQTLFRYQSTEKQLQCTIDHNKLVKDIISEQILPMLYNEKLISPSDNVLLKYRDTYLCDESRLVYYNYVEDSEIEIEICTESNPNIAPAVSAASVYFSRLILTHNIEEINMLLKEDIQNAEILNAYLQIYVSSLNAQLITADKMMERQEQAEDNLSFVICSILLTYGRKNILNHNDIIKNTLLLLASIFNCIPIACFSNDDILDLWKAVMYVLDSALYTYNPNNIHKYCDYPTYRDYVDDLLKEKPDFSEDEEALLVNTVEVISYLFTPFFESPIVIAEFQESYLMETIDNLFDHYANRVSIIGMFYYSYGHAVMLYNSQWNPQLPSLNNIPLSLMIVRFILQSIRDYVSYSLNYHDNVDIFDVQKNQISFTACYTYCLAAICSYMSDELEGLLLELNFAENIRLILDNFFLYCYNNENVPEEDALEFKSAFIHFLRLICIMTYDPHVCRILTNDDINACQAVSRSMKNDDDVDNEEERQQESSRYLTCKLCNYVEHMRDDPVICLLFSHIFRNLTCCKRLSKLLSIHNVWYSLFITIINEELAKAQNNTSSFSPEQALFVPRSVDQTANAYSLSISLINNFLRCIINLSTQNSKFLGMVTRSDFWTTGRLNEVLLTIPVNTSLSITIMRFMQLIVTSNIPYDRNVYMDLLSHTYNGIHNEYDSFEAMDSNVNRREKAEYELIYKEANDLASKLDGFIGDRKPQKWDTLTCLPIPDDEISYFFQTYPLGLYSLQLHHYLLLESLTLCAFFVAQDGKLPDYDNDPSYNMYLPLSTHVSSLSLILAELQAVHTYYQNIEIDLMNDLSVYSMEGESIFLVIPQSSSSFDDSTFRPASERQNRARIPPSCHSTLHRTLVKALNECNPVSIIQNSNTFLGETESTATEDYIMPNPRRVNNRFNRIMNDKSEFEEIDSEDSEDSDLALERVPSIEMSQTDNSTHTDSIVAEEIPTSTFLERIEKNGTMTGTLRGTLKNYVTLHSTLTGETMSVEQFRIVVRDLEKERGFKPIASMVNIEEDEKNTKMKIKRMITSLKNDIENDTHSLVILDFVRSGPLSRYWYVFQNLAIDLSEFSLDDYEMVLKGCIETLPQALQQATREEDKKDVFLIFRYLSDCCSLGGVVSRLVTYQGYDFIQCFVEFHRICCSCSDDEYLTKCIECILGILEIIVYDEDLIYNCISYNIIDLFLLILQHGVIVSDGACQDLIVFIAMLRQFFMRCGEEDRSKIRDAIRQVIDCVHDATCKRRLLRLAQ